MSRTDNWEMGAPIWAMCCGLNHDLSSTFPSRTATWTLLNPADGGDPLYFCDDCKSERGSR